MSRQSHPLLPTSLSFYPTLLPAFIYLNFTKYHLPLTNDHFHLYPHLCICFCHCSEYLFFCHCKPSLFPRHCKHFLLFRHCEPAFGRCGNLIHYSPHLYLFTPSFISTSLYLSFFFLFPKSKNYKP